MADIKKRSNCLCSCGITKIDELFAVTRNIVSKIMMAFEKEEKKNTALKITAGHLKNPVSSKTLRRELHKVALHGRAAI